MREASRDRGRLEHILSSIDRILIYMVGKTRNDINSHSMDYYGIVKHIEIIGEAAFMLTKEFRAAHPATPWDVIMKMRHVLVHDYYQIDEDEVWNVIQYDLPVLKPQIEQYISELTEQ